MSARTFSVKTLIKNRLRIASAAVVSMLMSALVMPLAVVYAESGTAKPVANGDSSVTSSEVSSALVSEAPNILAESSKVKTTSDSDSAIVAATAGATIDIPKDASDGITFASSDGSKPAIDISLPNADKAKDAQTVANGTVAYASNNGSASAVQATNDGGVRMLTIIDNPNAPTSYDYKVTVPGGGHIEIKSDGSAVVLSSEGVVLASVAIPWAKDATGKQIQTYFTTDGQTLTQHVMHNVAGVVYPVTADPSFWNIVGCIISVGIPIAVAIAIVYQPYMMLPIIANWSMKSTSGGTVSRLISNIHRYCRI